jgi:hypothetical protein
MVNESLENARKRVQTAVEVWVQADRECGELILEYVATSNVTPDKAKAPRRVAGAEGFPKLQAAEARLDAARKKMDEAIAYLEKIARATLKSR